MKAGDVRSAATTQLNPFDPWGDNNNDARRKSYERLYENDPLPEYNYKESQYGISPESSLQDGAKPTENYTSIDQLKEQYKEKEEAAVVDSVDQQNSQRNEGKSDHSDLVSEIGKEVLERLLGHKNSTDNHAEGSEGHALLEKLLGAKPEIKGFSSKEIFDSKFAAGETTLGKSNATEVHQDSGLADTPAGKVFGKVTSDSIPQEQKGLSVESNGQDPHQLSATNDQMNEDSVARKGSGTGANLVIEENSNAERKTDPQAGEATLDDDQERNRLFTLKISGSGKPVSFKADTSEDGSLLLKIPGNVKLAGSALGQTGTDQAEARSTHAKGELSLKQNSSPKQRGGDKSLSESRLAEPASHTGDRAGYPNPTGSPLGTGSEPGPSKVEHHGLSNSNSKDSKLNTLQISGNEDTIALLRTKLTGLSDWEIQGQTNERDKDLPILSKKNEKGESHDQDNEEESFGVNGAKARHKGSKLKESHGHKFVGSRHGWDSYPAPILMVHEPSLPIERQLPGYLPAREQERLPKRLNTDVSGWNPPSAFIRSNSDQGARLSGDAVNDIAQSRERTLTKLDILRLVGLARRKMAELRNKNLHGTNGQYGSNNVANAPHAGGSSMLAGLGITAESDGEKRYDIDDVHGMDGASSGKISICYLNVPSLSLISFSRKRKNAKMSLLAELHQL